jgi:serine/alanine adding enzyme
MNEWVVLANLNVLALSVLLKVCHGRFILAAYNVPMAILPQAFDHQTKDRTSDAGTIAVVQNLPESTWRYYVENHPNGNIFQTPEMFHVFAAAKGFEPRLWAAIQGERVLALLLPVEVSLAAGLFKSFTMRSVVYGGALSGNGDQGQTAMRQLILNYQKQTKHSVLFTEVRNLFEDRITQSTFQETRFKFEDHNDYIVNLAMPVEQVWERIHRSARKEIKQAQRRNPVSIRTIDDRRLLPQWYKLIQESFSWNHAPLADISLFESAFDVLNPKGMIQFLIGTAPDGHDIAASVALLYKKTIYGWYRGFDRKYGSCLPNDQMVWHILQWGAQNGYEFFDFGGAGRPNEHYGPRNFKAKFGGRLVNYGRNTYVHSPYQLKLSSFVYQLYRKIL